MSMTTDPTPTAPIGLDLNDGQMRWFLGNLAIVKLTGEDTGGGFSLVEMVARRGDMPPLHVHHVDDETFMVLEGEVSLHTPGASVTAGPGGIVYAPRGVPHVYRVESGMARWRVFSSPPAFPEFLLETSVPATAAELPTGPPSISPERLTEVAARYGIEILGPPGTMP
jgi:mannose-6-phosphate isomerase-like protein (cupin superfamily)